MAIVNQYKANYPIDNSLESQTVNINATSMINAINLLVTEKGEEPSFIGLLNKNVLTESTSETTINLSTICVKIDTTSGEEIVLYDCIAYPQSISGAKRGNTVYLSAPNYTFETHYCVFSQWLLPDGSSSTENPLKITLPLDESVSSVIYKAIYNVFENE